MVVLIPAVDGVSFQLAGVSPMLLPSFHACQTQTAGWQLARQSRRSQCVRQVFALGLWFFFVGPIGISCAGVCDGSRAAAPAGGFVAGSMSSFHMSAGICLGFVSEYKKEGVPWKGSGEARRLVGCDV